MALTNEQLEARIINIETILNDIQKALNNLSTKKQNVAAYNVRQNEVIDIGERLTSAESQLSIIQGTVGGQITDHSLLNNREAVDAHEQYALTSHNHDGTYSLTSHNHTGVYEVVGHDHDDLYYRETEHLNSSTGASDSGSPIVLNSDGLVDRTMLFDSHTVLTPTGTTQTLDFATERMHTIDLESATGNVTLTLNNPRNGESYGISVIQGGTARDFVWPAAIVWPGGTAPVITTTSGVKDYIQLMYDGSEYLGTYLQDFS